MMPPPPDDFASPWRIGTEGVKLVHMGDDDQWYYCVKDGTVRRGKESRGFDRMGPYPDRATAERALEIAKERNRAADEADERWKN